MATVHYLGFRGYVSTMEEVIRAFWSVTEDGKHPENWDNELEGVHKECISEEDILRNFIPVVTNPDYDPSAPPGSDRAAKWIEV